MKTIFLIVPLLLILIIGGGFLVTGDFFKESPQICFLEPLEKTSIDLYYSCEDFDEENPLKLTKIDQDELVLLSLELINEDREKYNSPLVELGTSSTAQEHAEELLNICKTSYWSNNGMKPYMRYSADGGEGAINENIAVIGTPEIQKYWTQENLKQILAWNQHNMVERDEVNEFRHSMNVLHDDHNYVNVGIAWSNFCVTIVHQFEDRYVEWKQKPILTLNKEFILAGQVNFNATIEQIDIFYDPIPMPLSDQELMSSPPLYGFGHICSHLMCSDGSLPVATVLPHSDSNLSPDVLEGIMNQNNPANSENIPLFVAHKWEITHGEDFTTFSIEEDLERLLNLTGKGVYTVLVWASPADNPSDGMVLTTISIFFL